MTKSISHPISTRGPMARGLKKMAEGWFECNADFDMQWYFFNRFE